VEDRRAPLLRGSLLDGCGVDGELWESAWLNFSAQLVVEVYNFGGSACEGDVVCWRWTDVGGTTACQRRVPRQSGSLENILLM